jgi:hypothetical protein
MCETYFKDRISQGWFVVSDPNSGETIRLEVAP